VREAAERLAPDTARWHDANRYFHEEDQRYLRFTIPEGRRVLELGCGTGALLAALKPTRGVGIDLSAGMVERAAATHVPLDFRVGDIENPATIDALAGEAFDFIVLSDTVGELEDVQATLALLHRLCVRDTRLVVSYYGNLWRPFLWLAQRLRLKRPDFGVEHNWLSLKDLRAVLDLAGFEVIKHEWRILLPRRWLGIGPLVNRVLAPLPLIRRLCVRHYLVARSMRIPAPAPPSVTIVIPARNERGNIAAAVTRMPRFAADQEIVFVEGHSKDGTLEEMHRVAAAHPEHDIKVLVQDGKGKGDAVRKGFDAARGDVLMILDADLTVPPEDLPKFYEALASGQGEFANGSRLVYPMQRQAMRFLNHVANTMFAAMFSYILNQRFTDTLCGTKVVWRQHYRQIAEGRSYFGDFDPFGDFDLIFGAAKANLKIVEIPIRYRAREYGETQISRFRHGWLLLRMVVFAYRKLKAF
jgi:SAM-dependent methyltransferase